jgi:hypothetical protein
MIHDSLFLGGDGTGGGGLPSLDLEMKMKIASVEHLVKLLGLEEVNRF